MKFSASKSFPAASWLTAASIAQILCSTGAFEIKYNDHMLFSKLEEGRMPTIEEVVHLLSQRGLKASTGGY